MKNVFFILLLAGAAGQLGARAADAGILEIPVDVVEDKIRGGFVGQLLGNLNGLPHEMKYIATPGKVESYTPALPAGGWTDDDTDIEWVYLSEMQKTGQTLLPEPRIRDLWRAHINRKIWCSNMYVRQLLDLGLEPPLTGRIAINPWASFNISGQFVCEAFGLMSPGMPQTAGKIGTHYTHFAVDGEPIQTTQLFTAMIAMSFKESNVERLVEEGLACVDPKSALHPILKDVLQWYRENPADWTVTRLKIKEKYTHNAGGMSDKNGYELNTAAVIAALLYGGGQDLKETLRLSFNFGWDADCDGAICGAIVGVIRGKKWIDAQGWDIKDIYKNTCRDQMPMDETITGYCDKICSAAKQVILENGGKLITNKEGQPAYQIALQAPGFIEALPAPLDRFDELKKTLLPGIEKDLAGAPVDRARAAYLAIALGEGERLRGIRAEEWKQAVAELKKFDNVVKQIFEAPLPMAKQLQAYARAEGLTPPPKPEAAKP